MNKDIDNLNQKPPQKKNKFLFDLNNFDVVEEDIDDIIEEEVDLTPPPPTFSEDDLEAAKAIAHSQGLQEGHSEERKTREQSLSESLKTIAESFSSLFAAEMYREKQYEEEALKLSLEVISLLAPSLNSRLGQEALKEALSPVLKSQSEQSEIRVEVHPDSAADIESYIDTVWADKDSAPNYKVVADSTIETGACQINWQDGGMIREPKKTAQAMKEAIEALLVEQVLSKDNSALTETQNNAIKEEETSDSTEIKASDPQNGDDGEQEHD